MLVAQLPVASCNWEYCPVVKAVKVVKVASLCGRERRGASPNASCSTASCQLQLGILPTCQSCQSCQSCQFVWPREEGSLPSCQLLNFQLPVATNWEYCPVVKVVQVVKVASLCGRERSGASPVACCSTSSCQLQLGILPSCQSCQTNPSCQSCTWAFLDPPV